LRWFGSVELETYVSSRTESSGGQFWKRLRFTGECNARGRRGEIHTAFSTGIFGTNRKYEKRHGASFRSKTACEDTRIRSARGLFARPQALDNTFVAKLSQWAVMKPSKITNETTI